MALTDNDILNCVELFNKYSNSSVLPYIAPSDTSGIYELTDDLYLYDETYLADMDPYDVSKIQMMDDINDAYSVYVSQYVNKKVSASYKKHADRHSNFVKVIYKTLRDLLPEPTITEDTQIAIVIPPSQTQYLLVTDGSTTYRKGVRDGAFVIDIALTALAFGGVEDTDWMNLEYVI